MKSGGERLKKEIDYILEVAKCGGITKAARNLYITPSALSKYIQNKETELNVRLFIRDGKKFSLTYAGERYVQMLKQMQEYQMKMDAEMQRYASKYMGRLHIGFQMSMSDIIIKKIVKEFQKQFPTIQILMEEESATELYKLLKNQYLDLIITLKNDDYMEMVQEVIVEDQIVLAAPKYLGLKEKAVDHQDTIYPWVSEKYYKNHSMIMYAEGLFFRKYAERHFKEVQITPHVNIVVKTTRTALMCVESGMGCVITSDLLIKQLGYEDKVDIFSFGKNVIREELAIMYNNNTMMHEEIVGFMRIAQKYYILI